MMSMGRYQDIDLIAVRKTGFCGIYFLYFLVPSVYHTFHFYNTFKHLMCSILVLEQNKIITGHCRDFVCRLNDKFCQVFIAQRKINKRNAKAFTLIESYPYILKIFAEITC